MFTTQQDLTGRVVSPGSWIFHKGLTFPKRNAPLKIHKDLYGIWYVASQLEAFSTRAVDEFRQLSQQHPRCFRTFYKNVSQWLEEATPNKWSQLEAQDPFG